MTKPRSRSPHAYGQAAAIGYLLNRTAHIVADTFTDELRGDAITLPVWRVLTALVDADGQSLSELATHAGAELSYLSRVVGKAEALGLVSRDTSPDDKRATHVSISAAGRALVRKLAPRAAALESVCLDGVSDADAETLRRVLRLMYDNVVGSQQAARARGRKLKVARRVGVRGASAPEA
jgi:DNA-binding MarR family transcriptional regulator